jgi:hypothetical protein
VPFREVLYRWRRTEEGRMAYVLWAVTPINPRDPWTCDHEEPWWDGDGEDGWYG